MVKSLLTIKTNASPFAGERRVKREKTTRKCKTGLSENAKGSIKGVSASQ